MKDLRLPMNALTFDQLVELGRAVIPTIAPKWTDHNVHDPGIMLMELVAWIAEAQMYSLSRVRRDERYGFAHLLNVMPHGPQPARGLIWPLADGSRDAPQPTWSEGAKVAAAETVTGDRAHAPKFFTTDEVALTTARIVKLETVFANGAKRDWTTANSREGATFLPFGNAPAPGDRLLATFAVPADGVGKLQSPFSLGVEVVNDGTAPAGTRVRRMRRLVVALEEEHASRPLRVKSDSSGGLLKSGVLLIDFDQSPPRSAMFTISIASATGGFLRSPRLQRIEPNVLEVVQRETVGAEFGTLIAGQPDQTYQLQREGLLFPFEKNTFKVQVAENGAFKDWRQVSDLSESGPDDRHFQLDYTNCSLTFGNGVNGFVPPIASALSVSYQVSSGIRGNLPRGLQWSVRTVVGDFGINSAAMTGGAAPEGLQELQSAARRRSRNTRPLVTPIDLQNAALSFSDLGVNRAIEVPATERCRGVRGTRTLVVLGHHEVQTDTPITREARELLDEVRVRLAPRLPVGQRLEVVGPRYVPLQVKANLVASRKTDPAAVRSKAIETLRDRLDVIARGEHDEWPFGRDVTQTSVKGWLRAVEGVDKVSDVYLLVGDDGEESAQLKLGARDLPQLRVQPDDVVVTRQPLGSER